MFLRELILANVTRYGLGVIHTTTNQPLAKPETEGGGARSHAHPDNQQYGAQTTSTETLGGILGVLPMHTYYREADQYKTSRRNTII